jgi:hypothetical protein
MHRCDTMSWFAPSPRATAVIVAVVVGLAALIETTLLAAPEVLPTRPQRVAPRASPPVTIEPSRIGVIDLRPHAARFRPLASRDVAPRRCRAPVRWAGRLATRPSVQG